MIELTYRRKTNMPVQLGVGRPPLRDQLPDGAVVSSMGDGYAVVLYPITTKVFKTDDDVSAFLSAHDTPESCVVEISKKVVAP